MSTTKTIAKTAAKASNGNGSANKGLGVEIPAMKINLAQFKVKSLKPLIVNQFPEKAKKMIIEKVTGKAKTGREARKPKEEYKASLYLFPDGKKTGFPAVGFKAAMVRAAKQLGLPMTETRGKFHVVGDDPTGELVEIKGKHQMREDMVRLANGSADVRYRAEYPKWEAVVTIQYNESFITKEQLANILNIAGFSCGIGEWRAEKSNSGSYGSFTIA